MPPDANLLGLMRDTVTAPRETAVQLLRLGLPQRTLLEAVVLLAALVGLVAGFPSGVILPSPEGDVVVGPILWSVATGVGTMLSAACLHVAGRLLGGRGSFEGALLVTVWINVMGLAITFVAAVLGGMSESLGILAFLAGLFILLWSLFHFVRVLHGFEGIVRTVLVLLLSGLGTSVGVSFILATAISFGVPTNV